MIMYLSTQSDNFDDYVKIIEDRGLWNLISANDLPIEFIRKWKDKLDWRYLTMVKYFTDDQKIEFADYLVTPEQVEIGGGFLFNLSTDEIDDILNLNICDDPEVVTSGNVFISKYSDTK